MNLYALTMFKSHWEMPCTHLGCILHERTARFAPEALPLTGLTWGGPRELAQHHSQHRRRVFLWWGTGLEKGESLHRQRHAENATCFGNIKCYLFRQGYRNNYHGRKTKPRLAPPIYKRCSVHTNDELFADCDCSIIYVEQKGIISNLGTDAVRAKLCIFVIRLTKYQFAHKLALHKGMCSHSPAGVVLKFIIGNNTKWVSYSHLHRISRLPCCIASIFLVILSCWSNCC